jgi:DNA topoisomerase-1
MAAEAEIIKSLRERFSNLELLSIKKRGAKRTRRSPTDMSRHTVNIDRDQARLYDLIWKRTLASQMSDAKLKNKRQN